jgi:hypothetical protein
LEAEAEETEMAAVMTTAKMVVVVITDKMGDGRWHIGGNSGA